MTPEEQAELLFGEGTVNVDAVKQRRESAVTSPQEGEPGPVRGFLGEAVKSLIPFGRYEEYMSVGEPNVVTRTASGIAKGATFNAPVLGSAIAGEISDRITGQDDQTFRERMGQAGGFAAEQSNLPGEIGGALLGAPRVAFTAADKAIRSVPKLGELLATRGGVNAMARMAQAGALGSTEAALYTLSEGKSLDEAQSAALFGAMFGAGGQLTAEGVAKVAKFIKPIFGLDAELRTSEDLVQLFKDAYGDDYTKKLFGQDMFDADAVAAAMQRSDETMTEVFPDALSKTVKSLSGTKNQKVAAATRALMVHMNNLKTNALPEFQDAVGNVLNSPQVRTQQQVINEGMALRETLQPLYTDALRNVARFPSGRVKGVQVRDVRQALDQAFRGASGGIPEAAKRRLMSILPPDMRGKKPREFTPKQLLELRQSLDSIIYKGEFPAAGEFDTGASIDRTILRNYLTPARNKVRELLYEVAPDLKQIDAQYSDEISLRHAYEAGVEAFKGKDGSALFETFLMKADRTPQELANFLEGVKLQLLQDLEGKTSANAVKNYLARSDTQGKLDLVRQVAGQDVVEQIKNQAARFAMINDITRGVDDRMPSVFNEQTPGLGGLGDIALMAGSVGNQLSAAIGAGAARRQLAQYGRQGTGPAAQAGVLGELLMQPADVAAQMVNENLQRSLPQTFRLLPGVGPISSEDQ